MKECRKMVSGWLGELRTKKEADSQGAGLWRHGSITSTFTHTLLTHIRMVHSGTVATMEARPPFIIITTVATV